MPKSYYLLSVWEATQLMGERLFFLLAWTAFAVHLQPIRLLQVFSAPGKLQCKQILSKSQSIKLNVIFGQNKLAIPGSPGNFQCGRCALHLPSHPPPKRGLKGEACCLPSKALPTAFRRRESRAPPPHRTGLAPQQHGLQQSREQAYKRWLHL